MKKQRFLLAIVSLLLILPVLSGCWDRRELDERIAVIGISIDQETTSDEEQPKYLLSVQVPIPLRIAGAGGGAGGEGGGQESVKVISTTGYSVFDAFTNLQKSLNQKFFLGQTRVIAISKEVAQAGVKDIIDGFRRDPSVRRLLWFLVVEGKAADMLHSDPKLETIPIDYIISLIQNGAKMGEIPDISLGEFYISISHSGLQPMLNYVRSSKEDISWIGLALFDDDKMIASLDADESWTLMQLRGDKPGGSVFIPVEYEDTKGKMMIEPKNLNTKTIINIKEDEIDVRYKLHLQANIIEKDFDLDLSKSINLAEVSHIAEEVLEEKARKLIAKLQHDYKVDALGLGGKIKAYHYDDWINMDWKELFPQANISVTYHVEFRRVGMELR